MAQKQPQLDQEFQEEYGFVRKDVRRVILTNIVIILLLVGLYFTEQKMKWLESLFSRF